MNRDELERRLLLAESGELGEAERLELAARLAADPEAAAWRDRTAYLLAAARDALPSGTPSAATRARIRAAAETRAARHPSWHYRSLWLQGLAYAAAVALIVGVWQWRTPVSRHAGRHVDRIAEMHALVAMTGADEPRAAVPEKGDAETRLRALAQDLLSIEGLAPDDAASEADFDDRGAGEQDTGAQTDSATATDRVA
jgi:hypothetical protein